MDQILDRLWLGDFQDAEAIGAQDAHQLVSIGAVLTLCERTPLLERQLRHVHAAIPDEIYLPRNVWAELLHALRGLLHDPALWTVLVHCRLGVSRSPALVAAYLVQCGHSATPQAALAYLVARRGVVAPHAETWRGILDFWKGAPWQP